jgi:hypothetical protein
MNTLTDLNFELYAAKYYDNRNCMDIEEFNDDLNRIKYVKRLFSRYQKTGDVKIQLIINHLVILYNVFYHEACTRMLVLKLNEQLSILKPFLMYLNYWPEEIDGLNNNIISSDIALNQDIVTKLREFK